MGLTGYPDIEEQYESAYEWLRSIGYTIYQVKDGHLQLGSAIRGRVINVFAVPIDENR
jgi:hypothetical protein